MNDIVAAVSSQSSAAINGTTAQGSQSDSLADSLFGLLMASELTGQESSGPAGAKAGGKKNDAMSMPELIAALMQYGNLMGIQPFAGDTASQQTGAAGTGTVAQTAPAAQAAASAQRQPAAGRGQAGLLSLMAARLLASSGSAAQAGQAVTQNNTQVTTDVAQAGGSQEAQTAQQFLNLLQALEGAPASATAQSQTDLQSTQAAQPAQNGMGALLQIKELFINLIEASQQADTTQQPDAAANASASAAQADEPAAQPAGIPPRAMSLASALLSALDTETPATAASGAQTPTQDGASGTDQGSSRNDAQLPVRADDAGKAEKAGAAGNKKEATGFDAALRAYHAPAQHAPATGLTESNTASAHARLSPAEAFDAIVDKIKSAGNAGQKEMEISLKPEFLGKVVIKLTMDEGGLVAKIAASNPKVQDAFASQAATLQSTLADQGLKDVRIVVTSTAVPDTALQQQASNGGQARQEQEKKRNPVVVESVAGPPAAGQPLMAYEQAYRTGTVNRLA